MSSKQQKVNGAENSTGAPQFGPVTTTGNVPPFAVFDAVDALPADSPNVKVINAPTEPAPSPVTVTYTCACGDRVTALEAEMQKFRGEHRDIMTRLENWRGELHRAYSQVAGVLQKLRI